MGLSIMQEKLNLHEIKFIQINDIIEKVEDGYSGALLYKITRGKNKFFLKVFKEILIQERIEKIVLIYEKLNIKSLHIIETGYIKSCKKYYIIYNFIEGKNLKAYNNEQNTNLKNIRKIGETIGKQLLKLKNYDNYDKKLFKAYDIDNDIQNTINSFQILMKDKIYRNIVLEYYTIRELEELNSKLIYYGNILKGNKPNLIHGDIKRANIMINKNEELYIVDIESMQVSYDILNFKYQMTWNLFDENKKELEFVKGYFDGIYNNKRPKNFNYHIIFIVILNFLTESYHRYKYSDIQSFKCYIEKCRILFKKLKKVDLYRDIII